VSAACVISISNFAYGELATAGYPSSLPLVTNLAVASRMPMEAHSGGPDDHSEVVAALQSVKRTLAMLAAYEDLLETSVFRFPKFPLGQKQAGTFQGVLRQTSTLQILSLLWKESSFVPETALAQEGLGKTYCGQSLNAHMMGADVSKQPREVSKNVSRVRSIMLAAEAYGLVDRITINKTKVTVRGTSRLHTFMKDFGAQLPMLPEAEQLSTANLTITK
jgi:hypothetical protein